MKEVKRGIAVMLIFFGLLEFGFVLAAAKWISANFFVIFSGACCLTMIFLGIKAAVNAEREEKND